MLLVLSFFVCVYTTTKRNRNEYKMFFTNIENNDLTTSQFTQILREIGFVNQHSCTFTDYLCTKIAENTQKIIDTIKNAELVFSNQKANHSHMKQLNDYHLHAIKISNDFYVEVDFVFTNIYEKAGVTIIEELKARNYIYKTFINYIQLLNIQCLSSFKTISDNIMLNKSANPEKKVGLCTLFQNLEQTLETIKTVTLDDLRFAIDSNKQTIKEIADFSFHLQTFDHNITDDTNESKQVIVKSTTKNNKKLKTHHNDKESSTYDTANVNSDIETVTKFITEITNTINIMKALLTEMKDNNSRNDQLEKNIKSILEYLDQYLSIGYLENIFENAVQICNSAKIMLPYYNIDIRMFFFNFLTSVMAMKLQIKRIENTTDKTHFEAYKNAIYSELLPRVQYLEDLTKLTLNNLNTIKNNVNIPTNLQINEKTVQINAHPSTSAAETSQQHTQDIHIQGEVLQDDILEEIYIDNSTETNVDDYEYQLVINMLTGNQ